MGGTDESTYQTLEFTLNEARDSFILESGSGENNQNDVIVTETSDGDGSHLDYSEDELYDEYINRG